MIEPPPPRKECETTSPKSASPATIDREPLPAQLADTQSVVTSAAKEQSWVGAMGSVGGREVGEVMLGGCHRAEFERERDEAPRSAGASRRPRGSLRSAPSQIVKRCASCPRGSSSTLGNPSGTHAATRVCVRHKAHKGDDTMKTRTAVRAGLDPQPLPPGARVGLDPQPLPPRVLRTFTAVAR
jgi:hypothetical protein